ncbi:hypothetical protein CDD80_1076 [Ophiocordyceps camponoti-rufipedis]|uniref:Uncharacterized protein n=1 Tax=Ophiocordyceps camponoti-rufipedis TaxID=2004952 RepID=A0A2C5YFV2_9HYPO|nr:hypothetical protein CDD80_1076 [Ophiocordyceps camponoti-rufipedis]
MTSISTRRQTSPDQQSRNDAAEPRRSLGQRSLARGNPPSPDIYLARPSRQAVEAPISLSQFRCSVPTDMIPNLVIPDR